MLFPHLIWLVDNNYSTIHNAIFRTVDDPLSGFKVLQTSRSHILSTNFFRKTNWNTCAFFC